MRKRRKSIPMSLCVLLMCLMLSACTITDTAALPFGYQDYSDISYEEAVEQLKEAGFTNIISDKLSTTDGDKEGMLKSVEVKGDRTFKEGDKKGIDTEITLSYYELKEYPVSLEVETEGYRGEPVFTIVTSLPDSTRLSLTLSNENYESSQLIEVDDGIATSEVFRDGNKPLSGGDYTLIVEMLMADQPTFTGIGVRNKLGSKGSAMTGEYVVEDSETGYKFVHAEFEYTSTYEDQPITLDMVAKTVEQALRQGFGDDCSVTYNEDMILAEIKQDGLATLATAAVLGAPDTIDSWNSIVESTKSASIDFDLMVISSGFGGTKIAINIVNDLNPENVLLTVIDGEVYFDFVNGIDLLSES